MAGDRGALAGTDQGFPSSTEDGSFWVWKENEINYITVNIVQTGENFIHKFLFTNKGKQKRMTKYVRVVHQRKSKQFIKALFVPRSTLKFTLNLFVK